MRHCPDSSRCPAIIVQPAFVRSAFRPAGWPGDTGHRAAYALPEYIDLATQGRLRQLLDHWLRTHGLHSDVSPVDRVVR